MIFLFTCGGRTGNQLFQLSHAIGTRRPKEWVISFGFAALKPLLEGEWKKKWKDVGGRFFRPFVDMFLYPVLYHGLVRTGLVTSHFEEESKIVVRKGKIRWFVVMRGYFESSRYHGTDFATHFRLSKALRKKVRPIVSAIPPGKKPIFVHIRRSDFKDLSLSLPERYYRSAVQLLRDRYPDIYLFVVGDDPDFGETMFRDIEGKHISHLSPFEDMALMSLCDGGILSNSTFSWWGAFFSTHRAVFVAPRYWSGWASKRWYPPEIRADFMTLFVEL
ncbi:MAG: alpha-1,2-fucosyltransferase [Spirochaetia bacterium]